MRAMRGTLAAAILCATLGGCAGGIDSMYSSGFWVQPGKYDFIKCPDIAQRSIALSVQEKTLMSQMERADQEVAGPLVNIMVYRAQLEQTRADLELLQQTSREKGCKSIVPTTNTPTPAPTPAPPDRPGRRH
jgi:hypothetical protein